MIISKWIFEEDALAHYRCENCFKVIPSPHGRNEQFEDLSRTNSYKFCPYCRHSQSVEISEGIWIDASMTLPNEGVSVLVRMDTGTSTSFTVARWDKSKKDWREGSKFLIQDLGYTVLSWMVIPEYGDGTCWARKE